MNTVLHFLTADRVDHVRQRLTQEKGVQKLPSSFWVVRRDVPPGLGSGLWVSGGLGWQGRQVHWSTAQHKITAGA